MARYVCTAKLSSGYADSELKKSHQGATLPKCEQAWIREKRNDALEFYRTTLLEIGIWVDRNEELLTEQYGLEGICDVLEVNPVHRAEVIEGAMDRRRSISAIAFISALEDSASVQSGRHPAECKDGPLYQALREKMKQGHTVEP